MWNIKKTAFKTTTNKTILQKWCGKHDTPLKSYIFKQLKKLNKPPHFLFKNFKLY